MTDKRCNRKKRECVCLSHDVMHRVFYTGAGSTKMWACVALNIGQYFESRCNAVGQIYICHIHRYNLKLA